MKMDIKKVEAISKQMELNEEQAKHVTHQDDHYYTYGNEEYMVLTDAEAQTVARRKPDTNPIPARLATQLRTIGRFQPRSQPDNL